MQTIIFTIYVSTKTFVLKQFPEKKKNSKDKETMGHYLKIERFYTN